jgi:hypothetical protein
LRRVAGLALAVVVAVLLVLEDLPWGDALVGEQLFRCNAQGPSSLLIIEIRGHGDFVYENCSHVLGEMKCDFLFFR